MADPTLDETKNRRWAVVSVLCLLALAVEVAGVLVYLLGRYEEEGAIAAAAGSILFQIFSILCVVFARTLARRIVSFAFLALSLLHWIALIVGIVVLLGSLSDVGGHMF